MGNAVRQVAQCGPECAGGSRPGERYIRERCVRVCPPFCISFVQVRLYGRTHLANVRPPGRRRTWGGRTKPQGPSAHNSTAYQPIASGGRRRTHKKAPQFCGKWRPTPARNPALRLPAARSALASLRVRCVVCDSHGCFAGGPKAPSGNNYYLARMRKVNGLSECVPSPVLCPLSRFQPQTPAIAEPLPPHAARKGRTHSIGKPWSRSCSFARFMSTCFISSKVAFIPALRISAPALCHKGWLRAASRNSCPCHVINTRTWRSVDFALWKWSAYTSSSNPPCCMIRTWYRTCSVVKPGTSSS